jgi:hypothetical protein
MVRGCARTKAIALAQQVDPCGSCRVITSGRAATLLEQRFQQILERLRLPPSGF